MLDKLINFAKRTTHAAVRKVKSFITGTVRHAESVALLSLSAVGLNALAGELPFMFALPMWIESTMVLPVLSVLMVALLIKSAEYRALNRAIA